MGFTDSVPSYVLIHELSFKVINNVYQYLWSHSHACLVITQLFIWHQWLHTFLVHRSCCQWNDVLCCHHLTSRKRTHTAKANCIQTVSMYKGYSRSYCMFCLLAKLKFKRNHIIRAALLYKVSTHGPLKEITVLSSMNTIQWHRNHGGNAP